MNRERFAHLTEKYAALRIAVVGDFCLDRYLEIDPARTETSIETGLPVYNIVNVRAQPGGAGTILNNLVALGIGTIYPVGFCGEDGEGYELWKALAALPRVHPIHFNMLPSRCTFTYCKPLVLEEGKPPRELNRLDRKNWTETPSEIQDVLTLFVAKLTRRVDAIAVLDQVDQENTGVVTTRVQDALHQAMKVRRKLVILADSRRGLKGFPPFSFKMNRAELGALTGSNEALGIEKVKTRALQLAQENGRDVFVTLSDLGIVGASPKGEAVHVPSLPLRGEIDIVGAGDAVTANLCAAQAAGATLGEAVTLANAAASVVIHKLGTTGTATVDEIHDLLFG
jgi:rfaE bifunctional protein kinase chain/domain